MNRQEKTGFIIAALGLGLICLAAGLAICYRLGLVGQGIRWSRDPASESPSRVQVFTVMRYAKCGDEAYSIREMTKDEAAAFVASLPSTWSVGQSRNSAEDSAIEVVCRVDDFCPEHQRMRLVMMVDGKVSVFRGAKPDPRFLMTQLSSLTEDLLGPYDVELLKKGLVLEDEPGLVDEKVRLYLEGLID